MEAYETFRDVLRQIAVHDTDPSLRGAAGRCLANHCRGTLIDVLAKAAASRYRPQLMAAYHGMDTQVRA